MNTYTAHLEQYPQILFLLFIYIISKITFAAFAVL